MARWTTAARRVRIAFFFHSLLLPCCLLVVASCGVAVVAESSTGVEKKGGRQSGPNAESGMVILP